MQRSPGCGSSGERFNELSPRLRPRSFAARTAWVSDHIPTFSEMPHGGYKNSGFGKDLSVYSLHEYTQVQHVAVDRAARSRKDWRRTIFATP